MEMSVKRSYSLRKRTFERLEQIRKRRGEKNRSAILEEAAEFWLAAKEKEVLEIKYEQGYRENPEKAAELGTLYKTGLTSMTPEEW
jgi:metal-responsive CopG/Arc/MetJ family transcriptional regulator